MYAHVSREEWLFRGLAIVMCLAMVGMAVMPLAVGEGWAIGQYYLAKTGKLTPEASLAISLAAIWHSTVWGVAVGMAFGTFPGAIAGAAIAV